MWKCVRDTAPKYLKRDVLNPAMAEINEKSDIEVTLLPPKRLRRKVVAVQFEVKEREADHARHDVSNRLKKFGLGQRDINMALKMHSDERLRVILDEIEHRHKNGSIKNVRAYTVTVLRDFEGDGVPDIDQERDAKRRDREENSHAAADAHEQRRKQERAFAKYQNRRLAEEERGLTDDAAAGPHEEFLEQLRTKVPFAFETYLRSGEKSALVQYELRAFKIRRLLGLREQDLESWIHCRSETASGRCTHSLDLPEGQSDAEKV